LEIIRPPKSVGDDPIASDAKTIVIGNICLTPSRDPLVFVELSDILVDPSNIRLSNLKEIISSAAEKPWVIKKQKLKLESVEN
jgi:hypothetical protein